MMVTINKHLQKYHLVTGVMKQVTVIFRNQFLLHHAPTFVSQSNPSMTSIQIQEHKPNPPTSYAVNKEEEFIYSLFSYF